MKKLLLPLLLVILTFTVVSCDPSYDEKTHKNDAETEYPYTVPYVYTKQCYLSGDQFTYGQISSIRHFDYNGHSYIQFHVCATHGGGYGIVHDPDCKCYQKDILK